MSIDPNDMNAEQKSSILEQSSSPGLPALNSSNSNKMLVGPAPRTYTTIAHNKMVLHSLKYTSRPTLGLLIGYNVSNKSLLNLHIMDAIPLSHNHFSAMVIELAFLQIEMWLQNLNKQLTGENQSKLQIIGVYFANENKSSTKKSTSAILIADQLVNQYGRKSIVLAQIINEKIEKAYEGNDTCIDWYMLRVGGQSDNMKDWKDIQDMYLVKSKNGDKLQKKISFLNISKKSDANNNKTINIKTEMQLMKSLTRITPKNLNNNIYKNKEIIDLYEIYLKDIQAMYLVDGFKQLELNVLLQNKIEEIVYDFEDHLDDINKDWRNIHCI